MYKQTDLYLTKLKKKIRIEFNRLSVLGFDELSVLNTRRTVNEMFTRLMAFNESEYLTIAKAGYTEGVQVCDKKPANKVDFNLLVYTMFRSYNPVTGYLYLKEADRKRARLIEMILSDKEKADRKAYEKDIRRAADLWYTQSMQYGQDIEDYAYTKALKNAGTRYVQWVAEHDDRTCAVCLSMDGNIYPINKIPPKQHYRCRCYWIPVREDVKTQRR